MIPAQKRLNQEGVSLRSAWLYSWNSVSQETKKKVEINRKYLNTYISVLDRKPEGKEFAGSTMACVISTHLKMMTQLSKEGVLTYGLIFQSPLSPVTSSMKANTKMIT